MALTGDLIIETDLQTEYFQYLETTDDKVWIALCLSGDEKGYTGLYNKYAKRLYNTIHRIVSHTSESEDILQETFVSVFSDLEKLSVVENFGAWIKRVAINKAISSVRKRKMAFTDIEETDIPDSDSYKLDDNENLECQLSELESVIAQLPETYRMIIHLHVFEDIQQAEIGNMLGISHTAVRSQYHRAKLKIMHLLKDKLYHE